MKETKKHKTNKEIDLALVRRAKKGDYRAFDLLVLKKYINILNSLIRQNSNLNHKIICEGGFLQDKCIFMMQEFFHKKREQARCVNKSK